MKWIKIIFVIFCVFLSVFVYLKISSKDKVSKNLENNFDSNAKTSNIIKDISYVSQDKSGNKYSIYASTGEVDYDNPNILFLSKVLALIELSNSNNIEILSDYGKYNSNNFDTIFSKNVIVNYIDNNITGEYLDFSLERGNMIISKNVVYSNEENILKADVIDINVETNDTKIFMLDIKDKVNIKSK